MTTPTTRRRIPASTAILATLLILAIAFAASLGLGWIKLGNQPADANNSAPAAAANSTAPADVLSLLKRLTDAGLPITNTAVQDETTDPNNLLGRPNGYIARASFDVPGGDPEGDKHTLDRGGVIEVWPTEDAARARSAYLQDLTKNAPILGSEFNYIRGPVLLRIDGEVKPSVAAQFEAAFLK